MDGIKGAETSDRLILHQRLLLQIKVAIGVAITAVLHGAGGVWGGEGATVEQRGRGGVE